MTSSYYWAALIAIGMVLQSASCGEDNVYTERAVTFVYVNTTDDELIVEQYDTTQPLLVTIVLLPGGKPYIETLGGAFNNQPPLPFSSGGKVTDSLVVKSRALGCRYFLGDGALGPIDRGDGPLNYVNYEEVPSGIRDVEDIPDTVTYNFTEEVLRAASSCD